jgi:hypothetical protein
MDAAPSPPGTIGSLDIFSHASLHRTFDCCEAPARIAGGRPRDWWRENHRRRRLAEQHDLNDVNELLQLELAVAQAEEERAAFEIALVRAGEEHRAQEREAASKMKIIQQELASPQEELDRRDRRIQGLEAAHEREIARVRQASEVEIVQVRWESEAEIAQLEGTIRRQKEALVKLKKSSSAERSGIRAMEAEDTQRMEPMELLDNLRGGG